MAGLKKTRVTNQFEDGKVCQGIRYSPTLPPHSTHVLQPCDVGFFKPMKVNWNKSAARYSYNNSGEPIIKFTFASVAWHETLKAATLINSFRRSGICPLNRNAIAADKIMPPPANAKPAEDIQVVYSMHWGRNSGKQHLDTWGAEGSCYHNRCTSLVRCKVWHGNWHGHTMVPTEWWASNAEVVLVDWPNEQSLFDAFDRVHHCYEELRDTLWTGPRRKRWAKHKAPSASEESTPNDHDPIEISVLNPEKSAAESHGKAAGVSLWQLIHLLISLILIKVAWLESLIAQLFLWRMLTLPTCKAWNHCFRFFANGLNSPPISTADCEHTFLSTKRKSIKTRLRPMTLWTIVPMEGLPLIELDFDKLSLHDPSWKIKNQLIGT